MNSTYEPMPLIIDPFILHFLQSTIEPPPPLPSSIFFYDPFLIVPPAPAVIVSKNSTSKSTLSTRFRYTPVQLFTLHRIFLQLPYPSLEQRRLIAEHLHLDVEQIRIWFSNRRSRRRGTTCQPNLLQPTSKESSNIKLLFNQLNLVLN